MSNNSANYRCRDCGKELKSNEIPCLDCRSTNRLSAVVAKEEIKIRPGFRGKLRDRASKRRPEREFKSVSKLSGESGREAREYYDVDRKRNSWVHIVEEKDENGDWKEIHHDDEPLTKHQKKQSVKKEEET